MYCYGCLYNAYTWKNEVYLSMITLVCELWIVWSLWICWESSFACAICGPLFVCCLSITKQILYENKTALCLACCHFLHVSLERENSRPITSWHVTLPSPHDTANYKTPRIAAKFCYHYSETNRNLLSVMQEPITPQHV